MKKSIYKKPEISLLYFDSEELATASKASYDLGGEGSEHQETGEIIDPGEGDGPGHNDAKAFSIWEED